MYFNIIQLCVCILISSNYHYGKHSLVLLLVIHRRAQLHWQFSDLQSPSSLRCKQPHCGTRSTWVAHQPLSKAIHSKRASQETANPFRILSNNLQSYGKIFPFWDCKYKSDTFIHIRACYLYYEYTVNTKFWVFLVYVNKVLSSLQLQINIFLSFPVVSQNFQVF